MDNVNLGPYRTSENNIEPKVPIGGNKGPIDFSKYKIILCDGLYRFLIRDIKLCLDGDTKNLSYVGVSLEIKDAPNVYMYLIGYIIEDRFSGYGIIRTLFLSCGVDIDNNGYLYKEDLINKYFTVRIINQNWTFEGGRNV